MRMYIFWQQILSFLPFRSYGSVVLCFTDHNMDMMTLTMTDLFNFIAFQLLPSMLRDMCLGLTDTFSAWHWRMNLNFYIFCYTAWSVRPVPATGFLGLGWKIVYFDTFTPQEKPFDNEMEPNLNPWERSKLWNNVKPRKTLSWTLPRRPLCSIS